MSSRVVAVLVALVTLLAPGRSEAQTLSPAEQRLKAYVEHHQPEEIALLRNAVNIKSATVDVAGVRATGAMWRSRSRVGAWTTPPWRAAATAGGR